MHVYVCIEKQVHVHQQFQSQRRQRRWKRESRGRWLWEQCQIAFLVNLVDLLASQILPSLIFSPFAILFHSFHTFNFLRLGEKMAGKGGKGLLAGKTTAATKDKDKKSISRSARADLQVL